MKNSQRGFIVPLLLAIIALLIIGGGAYIYTQDNQSFQSVPTAVVTTPDIIIATSTALQSDINFWIEHGGSVATKTDSVIGTYHVLTIGNPPRSWTFPNEGYTKYYNAIGDKDPQSKYHGQLVFINHDSNILTVPNADLSTFIVNLLNDNYAKDKNHVYLNGQVVPNVDPLTFVPK